MSFYRIIQGDIGPREIGVTKSHEHLICIGGGEVALHSVERRWSFVGKAVEEVQRFLDGGGKTIVNANPIVLKWYMMKEFALRLNRKDFLEPVIEFILVNNPARLFVFDR